MSKDGPKGHSSILGPRTVTYAYIFCSSVISDTQRKAHERDMGDARKIPGLEVGKSNEGKDLPSGGVP